MQWQDAVFLGGSIVIMISLVPTLRDEDAKVPLSTSIPSVFVLFFQTLAFTSLGMTASAAGTGMGFGLWTLIAKYKSPGGRERVRRALPRLASKLGIPHLSN